MPIGWQLAAHWQRPLGAAGMTAGVHVEFPPRRVELPEGRRPEMRASDLRCPIRHADMLRITVQARPDRICLKLEGDLAGIWVSEVEDSWRAAFATRDERPLDLDLTGVAHVDRAGKYLLGLLHCTGAHLIASGTRMTDLVQALKNDWPGPEKS